MTAIGSVELEVLRNAFASVCEEMNAALVRTAYSPNIKERRDCSCALFDADGDLVSQAENIPVHLGAMPFSVAAALDTYPPATLEPGDAILANDPYHGGAHLPDITLVTPIFGDAAEPIGFAANRAHHADVGGASASSLAADATDIYQEGLRIPPVKLVRGGDVDRDLLSLLLANVRTEDERRGDLRAQRAANETATGRLGDIIEDHGLATVRTAMDEVQSYSEARMTAELTSLPDGTYEERDVLDDDGLGNENLEIAVTVTIDDDRVIVDFAETTTKTDGPVNAPFPVTASATYFALRAVTDPDIPPNAGAYRPIEVTAPDGSLVNATEPAPVVAGNLETSQRIVDVVLAALAPAIPDRVIAGCQGTMNNLTIGGVDPRDGTPYTYYETQAGGFGARPDQDGMDGVHSHMTNTQNTPVEVLETAYPLRIEQYSLRQDSGGAGTFRGGLGIRRDVRVREHTATVSVLADRRYRGPTGIAGGEDGEPGVDYRLSAPDAGWAGSGVGDSPTSDIDDSTPNEGAISSNAAGADSSNAGEIDPPAVAKLPPKTTLELSPGEGVSIRSPGGGGYGDPADRPRGAIRADLEAGRISREEAIETYGVEPAAVSWLEE